MARLLPGVYSAINDLSQFPEGARTLNVGYIVQAERGRVNEWGLVTNPTDFLTKYTFSGTPSLTADPTFHSVIKVMAQTNSMYIVRAANNPLYGGAVIKKAQNFGSVMAVDQANETFLIKVADGEAAPVAGNLITLSGTGLFDSDYVVKEVSGVVETFDEYDEEGNKATYNVYEVTVTGDIKFEATGMTVVAASSDDNSFTIAGNHVEDVKKGDIITVSGATDEGSSGVELSNNGYFKVAQVVLLEDENSVYKTKIKIDTTVTGIYNAQVENINKGQVFFNTFATNTIYSTPVVALSNIKVATIDSIDADEVIVDGEATGVTNKVIYLDGKVDAKFSAGDKITVKGAPDDNDGTYTVVDAEFDVESNKTALTVKEKLKASVESGENNGTVYFDSIVNPEAAANALGDDDLMLITGIDPGEYNGKEAFGIVSALDNKNELVYYKGAEGLFADPCTFDTMQLTVYNAETNEALESFMFSRDPEAKTIDGISLFVDDVIAGSAYIKVFNNPATTEVPNSTLAGSPVQASGGSNGDPVTAADLVKALSVFQDKTIPVSILGNGCSEAAESAMYQQALLELANTRKDMFVFLNDPKKAETATLPSARAQAIVDYKKGTLASTSFYGCMYAPHVNTPDVFNARDVKIGADAVAIAGWLNVINSLNYPYAYAGPRNGLVSGVTCDWKIGDMSGEAEMLNDASVNYVAYDGKVGRYYMQCQNTLQIANSAMRNIGVVLNVLDIKETLVTYLKEFLNLPITDNLRRDIMDTVGDYLSPLTGVRFYNYVFQDVTTDADIAQDTLRYLLTLSPTRYAQRIYLVMNIVRTGFDFSILQSV